MTAIDKAAALAIPMCERCNGTGRQLVNGHESEAICCACDGAGYVATAPAAGEGQANEKLLALADRIDHEQLWARVGLERSGWTQEQRDRCDAGVELRRYADLLGQNHWRIFPPRPGLCFSASSLDAAIKMARKDREAAPAAQAEPMQAEQMARRFHETYERLAPQFGYTTRTDTRAFDPESANGKLMIAVCAALQAELPAVPWGYGWEYDSCGHAAVGRKAMTLTPNMTTSLRNVFARGPFALYTRATLPAAVEAVPQGLSLKQEPKYTVNAHAIVNRASGEEIPADEPVFIFRARDKLAVRALEDYALRCSDGQHYAAVRKRIKHFRAFASRHQDRMKLPDTAPVSASAQAVEGTNNAPPSIPE